MTAAVIEVAHDHELIALMRRLRAEAARFRVPARVTRGWCAAAYEIGRLLLSEPLHVRATVGVSGNCLELRYDRPLPDDHDRDEVLHRIRDAGALLSRMVADITVEPRGDTLQVVLAVELGAAAGEPAAQVPAGSRRAGRDAAAPVPSPDPPADHVRLHQAVRDLRDELDDTVQGIVALHAELDARAEEVRQAQARLRLLLDSAVDHAMCTLSPAGEVVSWDAGAERLFGYAAEEIVGRSFARFYTPGDREVEIPFEQLRRAREHGRCALDCLQVHRDGRSFEAHVTLTALGDRSSRALRGFALVVRDLTERKQLETDLRRRAEDLAAANRAKEAFLATLSHELRTPLNAMLGWTRLLRLGTLDARETTRALETIERNARVQEQLIADILDVSRIVTGRLRLELRPVDLEPVISAALASVRPAAEAKGVDLALEQTVPAPVLGDADRLQQAVWNLLVNAIKFTPPGGRVHVAIAREGPNVRMTVSDTGEGVSSELLPVVFDRFTQGDTSVTRPHGGLGLGLSIVRHIVELHGGRVYAYSEGPGRGATFAVHLPVRALQEVSAPAPHADQPLRGIRVLIVDDDADAREVVALALAQWGAETAAAASVGEALRRLAEFKPHVLISDIGMPGDDGYALIRRVRALGAPPLRDVPAVALTAYSRPEDERRVLGAGFQRFVPKPVEVRELADVVRTLV